MADDNEPEKQLSRRRLIQVSSVLALGLVYQKPAIETLHPKATLGQYGQQSQGDGDEDFDPPGGHGGNHGQVIVPPHD